MRTIFQGLCRFILFMCGLVLLISIMLYVFREPFLTGLGSFLVVNDYEKPADIIFVLNGDVNTRPFMAQKLFAEGLAPLIVIPQAEDTPTVELGLYPNTTQVAVQVLAELKVPAENILVLPFAEGEGATSTRDEALILRQYLEEENFNRVIVVSSAFHTRRTKWMFDKVLNGVAVDLTLAAAPYPSFDESNWWKNEGGFLTFFNEYLKIIYYVMSY